jgi:uncharacterized protein (TIGR02594 family)
MTDVSASTASPAAPAPPASPAPLDTMHAILGTKWSPSDGENATINGWLNFVGTSFPEMADYCTGETHIGYFSWCGCTVGYCVAKSGARPVYMKGVDTKSFLWAQAWLDWGTPVTDPQAGDVLVFDFGHGDHHVTLFDHDNGNGTWACLGGNQDHQVMISNFRRSQCIGIRRFPAAGAVQPTTPTSIHPEVKLNDVGSVVSELQHLLGVTVDGEFGPETDAAVRAYQATHGLDVDGDVGDQTWAALLAGKPATSAGLVLATDTVNRIVQLAGSSDLASHSWSGRGAAPPGYIKGMAVAYANVYAKWKKGDTAAAVMAAPNSGDGSRDAIAWYDRQFAALGLANGPDQSKNGDVLRHVFVLLTGLGMRESSGRCCEGRDLSASNTTADTAEAGLFQQSWNSRFASPELPKLFAEYSANPLGFYAIFSEGVTPHAGDLDDFGSGEGEAFQALCKSCPAFAVEAAAVGLRTIRAHWGPITRQEAELRPEADRLFQQVQGIVDSAVAVATVTTTTTTQTQPQTVTQPATPATPATPTPPATQPAIQTQSALAEILRRLGELEKVMNGTAAPSPTPVTTVPVTTVPVATVPVTTVPVTAGPVATAPVIATTLPADLARIEMDIARLGAVASTFSQMANQIGQMSTAGLPPQVAQAEQTITRLGQIAGTLSQYASTVAGPTATAAAKTQLSPIDKMLGGEALVGVKTPLAIAGYALMWILQTLGTLGTATGDKATTTGAILTALVSAFGALGVTAKFDRAFGALTTIAGILQKMPALLPAPKPPGAAIG